MDKILNASGPSHPQGNPPQWQLLGELTLSNQTGGDEQIHSWLSELFRPLFLSGELMNRIAMSASESAARILQPELKLEHIHLRVYGPRESTVPWPTWGFFRVEKIENPVEAGTSASHAVEFYLYTEGLEGTART